MYDPVNACLLNKWKMGNKNRALVAVSKRTRQAYMYHDRYGLLSILKIRQRCVIQLSFSIP